MNDNLEWALFYLAKGWSIIPLRPKEKKPLIKWEEFQRRRPTEEEVRRWWFESPDAGIGIVTGLVSGLVVVDVDIGKGGNPETIRTSYPTDLVVKSGSGGAHLYYRSPGVRVPNRVGPDGVDIRADGGYVVAPPSIHPTGAPYVWLVEGDPGNPPSGLLEITAPKKTSPETTANQDRWLSEILAGVAEGGRNDACARLAGYFAGKGVPADVIRSLLLQWNERNRPPLSCDEIAATVESVSKRALRSQERAEDPFPILDMASYMRTYGSLPIRWDIQDWLPESTIAFVVAPPGSYKTWLLLDLAVAIAGGGPFLGQFSVQNPGPVLVIQQEDFHGQVAERLAVITSSRTQMGINCDGNNDEFSAILPPSLPIYLHPDRKLRFGDKEVMETLARRIQEIHPRLIIIDPLYSTVPTDDYMAGATEQMFTLKTLRDTYGCSFLVAHHTKKRSDPGANREDLWGSQFLNAFMETGWQIRQNPNDGKNVILLDRHFKVRGPVPGLKLTFDIDTETPPFKYCVEVSEAKEERSGSNVQLLDLLSAGPMTATQLAEKLNLHRSTTTRKLRRLESEGVVAKDSSGRYYAPKLPEF